MIPSEHPINPDCTGAGGNRPPRTPLALPESKQVLVEFLIAELNAAIDKAAAAAAALADPAERAAAGASLAEVGEATARIARFFEFDAMLELCRTLARVGAQAGRIIDDDAVLLAPTVRSLVECLRAEADELARGFVLHASNTQICDQIAAILDGRAVGQSAEPEAPPPPPPSPSAISPTPNPTEQPRSHPAVVPAASTERTQSSEPVPPLRSGVPILPAPVVHAPAAVPAVAAFAPAPTPVIHVFDESSTQTSARCEPVPAEPTAMDAESNEPTRLEPPREQPKRFPAENLDAMLALAGDLAMQRNRLVALAGEAAPALQSLAGSVSRIASDLREQVIAARRQPLSVLGSICAAAASRAAIRASAQVDFREHSAEIEADFLLVDALSAPLSTAIDAIVAASTNAMTLALHAEDDGQHLSLRLESSEPLPDLAAVEPALRSAIPGTEVALRERTLSVRVPHARLVTPALMVEIGLETFALPVSDIDGVFSLAQTRDDLPIVDARELFNLSGPSPAPEAPVVVVRRGRLAVGLRVGRSLGIRDVIVRPLDPVFSSRGPVRGATLREDGGIALVADAARIAELASDRAGSRLHRAA